MPQTTKDIGPDFAGFVNHQTIHRDVWVVMWYISGHGWVATFLTCLLDAWIRSDKSGKQYIYRDALHPDHRPPNIWARSGMICKPPSHLQGGVRCDTRYQWPWMDCHTLHMSWGCIGRVSQALDVTHTCGCPPSRPQTTKSMGQDSAGFANQ